MVNAISLIFLVFSLIRGQENNPQEFFLFLSVSSQIYSLGQCKFPWKRNVDRNNYRWIIKEKFGISNIGKMAQLISYVSLLMYFIY